MAGRPGPLNSTRRRIVVAPLAQRQINDALLESRTRFGGPAAGRYAALIGEALALLAEQPDHPGHKTLALGAVDIHLFHIRHARSRLKSDRQVRSPRHVIAYRFDEAMLEVAQMLHDAMDLPTRLR